MFKNKDPFMCGLRLRGPIIRKMNVEKRGKRDSNPCLTPDLSVRLLSLSLASFHLLSLQPEAISLKRHISKTSTGNESLKVHYVHLIDTAPVPIESVRVSSFELSLFYFMQSSLVLRS
ncbi:hypothetical protein VNO77_27642 [Canavalia gladiata]|uniref:Uncharacterized protein n=1 Tax=Canavalia gladiata TaxID=3824 RepID=A0AAN9KUD7_CANGL